MAGATKMAAPEANRCGHLDEGTGEGSSRSLCRVCGSAAIAAGLLNLAVALSILAMWGALR